MGSVGPSAAGVRGSWCTLGKGACRTIHKADWTFFGREDFSILISEEVPWHKGKPASDPGRADSPYGSGAGKNGSTYLKWTCTPPLEVEDRTERANLLRTNWAQRDCPTGARIPQALSEFILPHGAGPRTGVYFCLTTRTTCGARIWKMA